MSRLWGPILGAVIVSLQPDLAFYLEGLPSLLANATVLGAGPADPTFEVVLGHDAWRLEQFYAQGILMDPRALQASPVLRVNGDETGGEEG